MAHYKFSIKIDHLLHTELKKKMIKLHQYSKNGQTFSMRFHTPDVAYYEKNNTQSCPLNVLSLTLSSRIYENSRCRYLCKR